MCQFGYMKIIYCSVFLFWSYSETSLFSPEKKYHLKLTHLIENLSVTQSDDILIFPRLITANSANQLFIMDQAILGVKVFNKDDRCSATIGRMGGGPGEFRDITAMTINHDNELIIVDNLNKRFSIFDSTGSFFNSYRIPHIINYPRVIVNVLDGDYYLLGNHKSKDLRIHRFTKEFQYVQSFFNLPIINESDKRFEYIFSRVYQGNIMEDSTERLYYIPGFYNGKIYVFKEDKLDKILLSKQKFKKSYEYKFRRKSSSRPILFKYHMMMTSNDGTYFARRNYISGGLNILEDGTIAHLLISLSKDTHEIGVELFSPDGSDYKYEKLMGDDLPYTTWSSSFGKWHLINLKEFPVVSEFALIKQ